MTKNSSINTGNKQAFAVWILTPNGAVLANKILRGLPDVCVYASQRIADQFSRYRTFDNLAKSIEQEFQQYTCHIFVMSTGIVVRLIAGLIRHKTVDPAVVVVDDRGRHAISLLSGHIGGANELTLRIADIIGARPVITTATDVNQLPAIDILAKAQNLHIENPSAIKNVNMAILKGKTIPIHDPYQFLADRSRNILPVNFRDKIRRGQVQGFIALINISAFLVEHRPHRSIKKHDSFSQAL